MHPFIDESNADSSRPRCCQRSRDDGGGTKSSSPLCHHERTQPVDRWTRVVKRSSGENNLREKTMNTGQEERNSGHRRSPGSPQWRSAKSSASTDPRQSDQNPVCVSPARAAPSQRRQTFLFPRMQPRKGYLNVSGKGQRWQETRWLKRYKCVVLFGGGEGGAGKGSEAAGCWQQRRRRDILPAPATHARAQRGGRQITGG